MKTVFVTLMLIALVLVAGLWSGVSQSKRKCPHCGKTGVTPQTDFDPRGESSTTSYCDHCGKEC